MKNMKTKKLKLLTIFLFLLPLCVVLLGAGCEKDDLNHDPSNIIGKWEWLYSVNGDFTASYSYPKEGQTLTFEFRPNNDLILRENGDIKSETVFSIVQDTLIYDEYFYVFEINNDTLKLINTFSLGDYSFYKRTK
jgi:hypothetical protein